MEKFKFHYFNYSSYDSENVVWAHTTAVYHTTAHTTADYLLPTVDYLGGNDHVKPNYTFDM